MNKRLLPTVMLIIYGAILFKTMVLKDLPVIRIGGLMLNFGGTHEGPPNLVPFKTIWPYLLGEKGWIIAGINLIGNIVLLVPVGFLVPFVFQNMSWKKSLALAVGAGFIIEGMQALLHVGIFDIDDIILNGMGVMVGYWAFLIFARLAQSVRSGNLIGIALVALVVAAVGAWYGVTALTVPRLPVNFSPAENSQTDTPVNGQNAVTQNVDPCNGTGGTGQIINVANNSITIRRHDGSTLLINFTDQTAISNAAGAASKNDLKTGDRVTVVVGVNNAGRGMASAIFICGSSQGK